MKKPNPSAPRQGKASKAPAPPPAKPFNEREQLAMAKALRAKKKPAPIEPNETEDDGE